MRGGNAHLTIVLGDPARADGLRHALEHHGVEHAAVVARVDSVRRSLVLGENDFVVVCIALDRRTIERQGPALRSLLADNRCFPTTVRTIGLLTDLGLTREAAELGCDVYVEDSGRAAEVIRLLDDAWRAESEPAPEAPAAAPRRLRIHGGWMFGTPQFPEELALLVPTESGVRDSDSGSLSTNPHPAGGPGADLRDPRGYR